MVPWEEKRDEWARSKLAVHIDSFWGEEFRVWVSSKILVKRKDKHP